MLSNRYKAIDSICECPNCQHPRTEEFLCVNKSSYTLADCDLSFEYQICNACLSDCPQRSCSQCPDGKSVEISEVEYRQRSANSEENSIMYRYNRYNSRNDWDRRAKARMRYPNPKASEMDRDEAKEWNYIKVVDEGDGYPLASEPEIYKLIMKAFKFAKAGNEMDTVDTLEEAIDLCGNARHLHKLRVALNSIASYYVW